MISADSILSRDARRRYDESGDPVYTTTERLLLALRWFDWCSMTTLLEALGLEDATRRERNRYSVIVYRLAKHGRIEMRGAVGADRRYRLAAKQPAIVSEPEVEYDEDGNEIAGDSHDPSKYGLSWRKRRRADGLCVECPQPAEFGKRRCRPCLDKNSAGTLRRKRQKAMAA